jgi:hypothetical protein
MMTTELAAKRLAAFNKVMLGIGYATVSTSEAVRPTIIEEPLHTSPIIGEVAVKVFKRVLLHQKSRC